MPRKTRQNPHTKLLREIANLRWMMIETIVCSGVAIGMGAANTYAWVMSPGESLALEQQCFDTMPDKLLSDTYQRGLPLVVAVVGLLLANQLHRMRQIHSQLNGFEQYYFKQYFDLMRLIPDDRENEADMLELSSNFGRMLKYGIYTLPLILATILSLTKVTMLTRMAHFLFLYITAEFFIGADFKPYRMMQNAIPGGMQPKDKYDVIHELAGIVSKTGCLVFKGDEDGTYLLDDEFLRNCPGRLNFRLYKTIMRCEVESFLKSIGCYQAEENRFVVNDWELIENGYKVGVLAERIDQLTTYCTEHGKHIVQSVRELEKTIKKLLPEVSNSKLPKGGVCLERDANESYVTRFYIYAEGEMQETLVSVLQQLAVEYSQSKSFVSFTTEIENSVIDELNQESKSIASARIRI